MEPFGWAYIGCGYIARKTARQLVRSEGHRIVSAWNRTPERAEEFAREFGASAYSSIEAAITAPGVDGVYIAVTTDMHMACMLLCIKHRKPVLCEKAFTVNVSQAEQVFSEAARAGVYVSEAMWTWHNATARQVRSWVQDGEIGRIRHMHFHYGLSPASSLTRPRLIDPNQLGGALLDIGVYGVRYCYELFGMPEDIRCTGRLQGGVDLGERVELQYDGFRAELRFAIDRMIGERALILGTDGMIVVPTPHAATQADMTGRTSAHFSDPDSLLYVVQFQNAADEIRAGLLTGGAISAKSTLDVLSLLDECRAQMGLVYPAETN